MEAAGRAEGGPCCSPRCGPQPLRNLPGGAHPQLLPERPILGPAAPVLFFLPLLAQPSWDMCHHRHGHGWVALCGLLGGSFLPLPGLDALGPPRLAAASLQPLPPCHVALPCVSVCPFRSRTYRDALMHLGRPLQCDLILTHTICKNPISKSGHVLGSGGRALWGTLP